MLVIKPRTQGAGIFDVISKVANSALTKKVINSTIGRKVIEKATKENLIKAANSAIGKQIQTAVVKGVADASEKAAHSAFQKLGVSPPPSGNIAKVSEKAVNSTLKNFGITPETKIFEKVLTSSTLKRKLPTQPGRSKKRKRARAIGTGIILE
jgi:hypothetical protein